MLSAPWLEDINACVKMDIDSARRRIVKVINELFKDIRSSVSGQTEIIALKDEIKMLKDENRRLRAIVVKNGIGTNSHSKEYDEFARNESAKLGSVEEGDYASLSMTERLLIRMGRLEPTIESIVAHRWKNRVPSRDAKPCYIPAPNAECKGQCNDDGDDDDDGDDGDMMAFLTEKSVLEPVLEPVNISSTVSSSMMTEEMYQSLRGKIEFEDSKTDSS